MTLPGEGRLFWGQGSCEVGNGGAASWPQPRADELRRRRPGGGGRPWRPSDQWSRKGAGMVGSVSPFGSTREVDLEDYRFSGVVFDVLGDCFLNPDSWSGGSGPAIGSGHG